MDIVSFISGFALAAVFCSSVAWIVCRSISSKAAANARNSAEAEGREMLDESRNENVELQKQQAKLQSDYEYAVEKSKELSGRIDEIKVEAQKRLNEEIASRDAVQNKAMEALRAEFNETISKMTAQMKLETDEMLKSRQKEFSETSKSSIGDILNPLKENIENLKKTMDDGNKQQAMLSGQMKERIQLLMEQSEAAKKSADELAAAFRNKGKVQGDWGERVLNELLESQGLTEGIHYDIQDVIRDADGNTVKNENGNIMRPDVILHLDECREVIIDSKVSLSAYIDYVNADNEQDKAKYLAAHLESIKSHVKELAVKRYQDYVKPPKVSAGYVIMFVPNTGALWTAMNAEPALWRRAADQNVYMADEQSLYGALRIVEMTWTQVRQARNHEQVYALAQEMIDRVGMFMESYNNIGAALKKASSAYDEGYKKISDKGQSVITTSNKLIALGVKNGKNHPIGGELIDKDSIPQIGTVLENQH